MRIFYIGNDKSNKWYNLFTLLKFVVKHSLAVDSVDIKGFYGSPLTDLTNYQSVSFSFGMIDVLFCGSTKKMRDVLKLL